MDFVKGEKLIMKANLRHSNGDIISQKGDIVVVHCYLDKRLFVKKNDDTLPIFELNPKYLGNLFDKYIDKKEDENMNKEDFKVGDEVLLIKDIETAWCATVKSGKYKITKVNDDNTIALDYDNYVTLDGFYNIYIHTKYLKKVNVIEFKSSFDKEYVKIKNDKYSLMVKRESDNSKVLVRFYQYQLEDNLSTELVGLRFNIKDGECVCFDYISKIINESLEKLGYDISINIIKRKPISDYVVGDEMRFGKNFFGKIIAILDKDIIDDNYIIAHNNKSVIGYSSDELEEFYEHCK